MASVFVYGPIGSGKTTLAHALAERVDAVAILEGDETANPHLAAVHADPEGRQAANQHWFSEEALSQAATICRPGRWIWDRPADERLQVFAEAAYASGHVEERAMARIRETYSYAMELAGRPRMRIHLLPGVPILAERVRARGRPYERDLDDRWLAAHVARCEALYARALGVPVLTLGGDVDVRDPATLDAIASRVIRSLSPAA